MHSTKRQFQKPIRNTIRLDASREKIWEVISSPGNLEHFHPFCQSNPVTDWPGEESIDHVHYYNGLIYNRKFTKWDDGIGYELLIGKKNGRKSQVVWHINEINSTSSELSITIFPHQLQRHHPLTQAAIYYLYTKPALHRYLSSVLQGLQFYISTNQHVRKNQFGMHRWFSN